MKNERIQLLRVFLFLGIVVFHFGLSGSALLWGVGRDFFPFKCIIFNKKITEKK